MATGKPAANTVATLLRPMAKATGTPSSNSSVKLKAQDRQFHAGTTPFTTQQGHEVLHRKQHDQGAPPITSGT